MTLIWIKILSLILIFVAFKDILKEYKRESDKILTQKRKSEVGMGLISEQLAPFLENFKWNPREVQFIGKPIDYIAFEKDRIVFIEIKSGNSSLTTKQRQIRTLVKEGKIEFETLRIK